MSCEIVPSCDSTDSCPPSPISSIDSRASSIDQSHDSIAALSAVSISTMSGKPPLPPAEKPSSIMTFESAPSNQSTSVDCPIFRPFTSSDSPRNSGQPRSRHSTPSSSPSPRSPSRTKRVPLNHSQKMMLETFYALNQYPNRSDKHELSERIGLDVDKVHKWFDNRRTKANKDRRCGVDCSFGAHNVARSYAQIATPMNNQQIGQGPALSWFNATNGQHATPINQPAINNQSLSQLPTMQNFIPGMMPFQQQSQQQPMFDVNRQQMISSMQMQPPQNLFPMNSNINQTTSIPITQNNNQIINQQFPMQMPFIAPSNGYGNVPQFGNQPQFTPMIDPAFTSAASLSRSINSMIANPVGSYSVQPSHQHQSQPFGQAVGGSTLPPSAGNVIPPWFNAGTNPSMQQSQFNPPPVFQQVPNNQQQMMPQRPEINLLNIPANTHVATQSKPRSPNSAFSVVPRKAESLNSSSSHSILAPTAVKRQKVELVSSKSSTEASSPSNRQSNSKSASSNIGQSQLSNPPNSTARGNFS